MEVELVDLTASQMAEMDTLFSGVQSAIVGADTGMVLSVLSQLLVNGSVKEATEDQLRLRVMAIMALLAIMNDGAAVAPYDQGKVAETISNLSAIVTTGSRALIVPALVYTLIASVCNGRRLQDAEVEAAESIRTALKALEARLR